MVLYVKKKTTAPSIYMLATLCTCHDQAISFADDAMSIYRHRVVRVQNFANTSLAFEASFDHEDATSDIEYPISK